MSRPTWVCPLLRLVNKPEFMPLARLRRTLSSERTREKRDGARRLQQAHGLLAGGDDELALQRLNESAAAYRESYRKKPTSKRRQDRLGTVLLVRLSPVGVECPGVARR